MVRREKGRRKEKGRGREGIRKEGKKKGRKEERKIHFSAMKEITKLDLITSTWLY